MCTSSLIWGVFIYFLFPSHPLQKWQRLLIDFTLRDLSTSAWLRENLQPPSPPTLRSTYSELWSPKMTGEAIRTPPPTHMRTHTTPIVCLCKKPVCSGNELIYRRGAECFRVQTDLSPCLQLFLFPPAYFLISGKDMNTKEVRMRAVCTPERVHAGNRWAEYDWAEITGLSYPNSATLFQTRSPINVESLF